MPKSLVLGNGNILVCLDKNAEVRDFYFPYVGLENHAGGRYVHRIGVWTEEQFSWLDGGGWKISVDSGHDTLSGQIQAENPALKIRLEFHDVVYNEKNILIRKVIIKNLADRAREIKIFFHQEFEIYESHRGDTAYYDPKLNVIIHYKGRRVFLVNARSGEWGFDDYSVGIFSIEGKEGTFKDAEDGKLTKNPIEHGKVDSVIAVSRSISADSGTAVYYWLIVAETIHDAKDMNEYVLERSPQYLIKTTGDFWNAWVNARNFTFFGLDKEVIELFKKSLLIIRSHVSSNGAIIASGDSDMLHHGRDTYSYVWPRDGAIAAEALDKAGDSNVAKRFFEFSNDIISEEGYFMHKYRPDKSLGASWHPWVRNGRMELPIQEDGTALILDALWKHYERSKDLEFVESIYNSLIKKSAEFLLSYTDKEFGLPNPSYDLWEEKHGISTFTSGAVYAALIAASNFARLLGKSDSSKRYKDGAEKIKAAVLKYMYNEKDGWFSKLINFSEDVSGSDIKADGRFVYDNTLDMSSVYAIYRFGILSAEDERLQHAINAVEEKLWCKTDVGGVARYVGDNYYRSTDDVPGNPWFITTLWLAQYYLLRAKSEKELDKPKEIFKWVAKYSLPSGILSEQIHPRTGEQISAAPLIWSHAEFVASVILYLEKLEELGICLTCYPV